MKNVDFSNGIRGKHSNLTLDLIGAVEEVWAICVTHSDKSLIPLKVYKIVISNDKIRVKNEQNIAIDCPKTWFAPLKFSQKVIGLIEKVA
jgi:hypothetical protein